MPTALMARASAKDRSSSVIPVRLTRRTLTRVEAERWRATELVSHGKDFNVQN